MRSDSDGWIGYIDSALSAAEIRSPEEQATVARPVCHWYRCYPLAVQCPQMLPLVAKRQWLPRRQRGSCLTWHHIRLVSPVLCWIICEFSRRNHEHKASKIQPTKILSQNLRCHCENIFFSQLGMWGFHHTLATAFVFSRTPKGSVIGCFLSLLLTFLSFTWFVNWTQVSVWGWILKFLWIMLKKRYFWHGVEPNLFHLSPLILCRVAGGLSLSQLISGKTRGIPWTGC